MTTLYRMFDRDGALLYVGISSNLDQRLGQHERGKPWWSQVVTMRIEHYPTRAHAAAAERNAIVHEKPRWNIAYNLGSTKPVPALFMALLDEHAAMLAEQQEAPKMSTRRPAPSGDPKPCHVCGHGILGTPSAIRIDGRIRLAHDECRAQVKAEQRDADKRRRQDELEERRIAVMRGDVQ